MYKYILFVYLPLLVRGWGYNGHHIVAQLGDNMLTPNARSRVYELLEPGQTLADISSWPDDYDHSTDGKWSSCLHYVNINSEDYIYNFNRDCLDVGSVKNCCVVEAILNYTTILSDGSTSRFLFLS